MSDLAVSALCADQLQNTVGCPCDDLATDESEGGPQPATLDTLTDAEEIQEGWLVQLKGSPQARRIYPNPVQLACAIHSTREYQVRSIR